MQARVTPGMNFCVEVVTGKLFTDKPLKHCPEKNWKKKKKEKDRESDFWNFLG